ncbi:MAG: hypothetical protein H6707_08950 [Deltaproteobacteria bacterium]|nr:hypothetical protein [Deltaproteobacteria bacterium]
MDHFSPDHRSCALARWQLRHRGSSVPFGLTLVLLVAVHSRAQAYDFEVDARTEANGYQLRVLERDGVSLINRRRVTQYLGLRIFDLLPHQQGSGPQPQLDIDLRMRFLTDFGAYARPPFSRKELRTDRFELLFGALHGRNLLGDLLDFSLGRKLSFEMFDVFAFDGLWVRLRSRRLGLFVESYFGQRVDRMQLFSVAVYDGDGTADEEGEFAPSFGAAVGIDGEQGFGLRASYRGVISYRDGEPQRWAMQQEALFFSLLWRPGALGAELAFASRYDLLLGVLSDVSAELSQQFGPHRVALEYLASEPHFDGDSIFNVFASDPFREFRLTYAVGWRRFRFALRSGYQFVSVDGESPRDAVTARLSGQWRTSRQDAQAELYLLSGLEQESQFGADLSYRLELAWWCALDARLSLMQQHSADVDDLQRLGDLFSAALHVGGQLKLTQGVVLYLAIEDNISRLYHNAFRAIAVLDMRFAP